MRIGIFGGSFNPPHKMHLKIAQELLQKKYVDKIIFVPTGSKYKYKMNLLPDKERLDMLKLMTKKEKRISVSDYELKNKIVYTWETLAYFKNKYKKEEVCFICGVDNLSYMDKWEKGEEILKNYKILVIDRKTHKIDEILKKLCAYKENIILTKIDQCKLSSTYIRKLLSLKKFDKLVHLMDKEVLEYIIKNNLYRSSKVEM